jgi:hypothetical protein
MDPALIAVASATRYVGGRLAGLLAWASPRMNEGTLENVSSDVRDLTGRDPTSRLRKRDNGAVEGGGDLRERRTRGASV